jgi:hypothetical protein
MREDNRRLSNGRPVERVAKLTLGRKPSADPAGIGSVIDCLSSQTKVPEPIFISTITPSIAAAANTPQ